ncbi:hypothetical protein PGT21_025162 [Puccinia graminis f. sp. tritici]|uniref:Uncharacterized protein n=1 Tax=Puccinia graminis f. sp. tritici TaxID=56615 RepID=A0A5B0MCS3_PUCGR|nr:hypothetical protein PGT21_025162 [Puccinia graminis f. sp. tritici]
MRSIKQVIRLQAENSRGCRSVPSVSAHPRSLPVASSVEKFSEPLQHPYTRPGPRDNPCLMTPGCRDRSSMDKGLDLDTCTAHEPPSGPGRQEAVSKSYIHLALAKDIIELSFMSSGCKGFLQEHAPTVGLIIRFKAERLDKVFGNRKAEAALSRFLLDTNRFPEHLPR